MVYQLFLGCYTADRLKKIDEASRQDFHQESRKMCFRFRKPSLLYAAFSSNMRQCIEHRMFSHWVKWISCV